MQFQFTRKNLDTLLQQSGQTFISIYLPTQNAGTDQKQNPILFANLIKKAREQLEKSGFSSHKLKLQLDEAEKLGADGAELWDHLKHGLALFISESDIQIFKLPMTVKDSVAVSTYPYIKPLLPMITTNGKFYILTLSQNDVKLYQANRDDIDKVYLGDMALSMEEHFDYSDLTEHIQHHAASQGGSMFHGQGGGDESYKADISQFLNSVENRITDLLENEQAPLVLAGVEYLTSMYAKHNRYNHLVETIIEGNPENTTKDKLHASAWEIVREIFKQDEQKALDTYHDRAGTGKTGADLDKVVVAAFDGKVETLFILRGCEVWGEYVTDKREVLLHDQRTAHSSDLLELATSQTLVNGGTVYSLKEDEMVEGKKIAAVYRY